jgi:hypothetical protein
MRVWFPRTGEVQVHKSDWVGLVKMAFYYAFYYAILFFTTLFTTLREAPTNDLMFFGTFQTASTVCSNKFSFLLLKKSFELKYSSHHHGFYYSSTRVVCR